MDISLAQKAISLALHGDWSGAVDANLEILKLNPTDVDALNRLARAYAESGKIGLAKSTTQKALEIDPFNAIALKCLEKWKSAKSSNIQKSETANKDSFVRQDFIEESGKTKLVTLMNPGDSKVLAMIDAGDEVKLHAHPHSVSVVTPDNKHIGRLPDDIAARLKNLIKNGNKYQTLIKSVNGKEITVFIKEIEKGANSANTTSFPTEKIDYVSFTPPELVHKDESTDSTEVIPED